MRMLSASSVTPRPIASPPVSHPCRRGLDPALALLEPALAVARERVPAAPRHSPDQREARGARSAARGGPASIQRARRRREVLRAVGEAESDDRDRQQQHRRDAERHQRRGYGVAVAHPREHALVQRRGGEPEHHGPRAATSRTGAARTHSPSRSSDERRSADHELEAPVACSRSAQQPYSISDRDEQQALFRRAARTAGRQTRRCCALSLARDPAERDGRAGREHEPVSALARSIAPSGRSDAWNGRSASSTRPSRSTRGLASKPDSALS